jgi:hypothetical protein
MFVDTLQWLDFPHSGIMRRQLLARHAHDTHSVEYVKLHQKELKFPNTYSVLSRT